MAYLINNYDGSPLVNVPDRTLNITTTSLKLPGRDYAPYGETMVENLIHMLQHFAQGVPPANPISGQLWFDTSVKQVRVYDDTTLNWISVGSPQSGPSFPTQGASGQIFYHTVKRQIFVWDQNAIPPAPNWRLVGPAGAFDNVDPEQPQVPTHSAWEVVKITPLITVWRLTIAGSLVAIVSQDTFNAGITGFADPIRPGINLRSTFNLVGTASKALMSDNSLALDSLPANRFMRVDLNNAPDQNLVRSLGSQNLRYASMHAAQFVGQATSAITATTATNANNLNNQPASFYLNASNLTMGTLPEARLPSSVIIRVYESVPFAILNAGTYSLTHGLGGVPRFVTVDLVNLVPDGGYIPGDIIQISITADPATANEGVAVKKTSTNVIIYIGSNSPAEYVRGDGSGAGVVLTATSWLMVVRAYR